MSHHEGEHSAFERHARALLEESVTHIDGRVRSRLNQARQAALAQLKRPQERLWRPRTFVPAGLAAGLVAAVVLVVWHPLPHSPAGAAGQASFEDIELLADSETFELMADNDGAFYEWAAAQSEPADGSSG